MRPLLVLVACSLAPALDAQAGAVRDRPAVGTVLAGDVSGVWTADRSPYLLVGPVRVGTLVVRAGVEVRCAPGAGILVQGSLTTRGTQGAPVRFTSLHPAARWPGLRFASAAGTSSLDYTRVERADQSGVRIVDSAVTLTHCTLLDNVSPTGGGGLRASLSSGDLVLSDCVVTNNASLAWGGGMEVLLGTGSLRMDGTHLVANTAVEKQGLVMESGGGGLSVSGGASVDLVDCRFSSNVIKSEQLGFGAGIAEGAGLRVQDVDLTMTRCIVSDNTATGFAGIAKVFGSADGGLWFSGPGRSASLDNTIVAGNLAFSDASDFENAAGIALAGGALTLTNCVLARNTAHIGYTWSARWGQGSSGLRVEAGTALLQNTIVHGNTMFGFYSLWFPPGQPQLVGNDITVRFGDVEGGYPGTGNLDVAPHFAGPGTSYVDFALTALSPCIDAGDPDPAFDDVSFPPSLGGARNDLGVNGGPLAGGWFNW